MDNQNAKKKFNEWMAKYWAKKYQGYPTLSMIEFANAVREYTLREVISVLPEENDYCEAEYEVGWDAAAREAKENIENLI